MALTTTANWDTYAESRTGGMLDLFWMVEVVYNGVNTHYMATKDFTFSSFTWEPFVLSVGAIPYQIGDDQAVSTAAGTKVRLRRGSISGTADTMDDRYLAHTIYGKAVTIRANFGAGVSANLTFSTFVITGARVLDKGTIELDLRVDETPFIDLPQERMVDYVETSQKKYPPEADTNKLLPLVVGDVLASSALNTWQTSLEPLAAHTHLQYLFSTPGTDATDGAAYFMLMTNEGDASSYPYFLEYVPNWDAYANCEAATNESWGTVWHDVAGSGPPLYVNMDGPARDNAGWNHIAEVREMAVKFDGTYTKSDNSYHNTVADWNDLPAGPVTIPAGGRLCLRFAGQPGDPPDLLSCEESWMTLTVDSVASGTLTAYEGSISADTIGSSVGTVSTVTTTSFDYGATFDIEDKFFLLEMSSGGGDEIVLSDLYFWFRYRKNLTVTKKVTQAIPVITTRTYNSWGSQEPKTHTTKAYPENSVTTNIVPESTNYFAPLKGPTDTIQPVSTSYTHDTPPYVVYYILNSVLGVAAGSIDGASFDSVYSYLVTDAGGNFNTWHIGRQVMERVNSLALLEELCAHCGMLLWRSGDGKFKVAVVNHAGSVVETFGDEEEDFPAWDFTWELTPTYYNRFQFNYRWSPAQQKFLKKIVVNPDATVSAFLTGSKTLCTSANTNYGADVDAPEMNCYWFWEEDTTENFAKIMIKATSLLKRRIRFTTKMSGAKVEIGDTIRTDHQNQDWTSADVDFQVRAVRIDPGSATVEIEALEISDL